MAVGSSLAVNGAAQVQSPYDSLGAEVEMLVDDSGYDFIGDFSRARGPRGPYLTI